jgi:hypothetical protein
MAVILKEAHERILRKVKWRHYAIHLLGVLLTLFILLFPLISKLQGDLIRASYGILRHHLSELHGRYALLEILRNKPLSVGEALEVADVVMEEARVNEVPVHLVLGIMSQESAFRSYAVSEKGARGLMQLMPIVWKQYMEAPSLKHEISSFTPALNVRVALRYLGDLFRQHGDWKKVLKAYGGYIDQPPDTYIRLVMSRAEQYKVQLGDLFYTGQ